MTASKEKRDKHGPVWAHDYPFRRLFDNPNEFCPYVTKGQVIADLGCGTGYYTLPLAESVGPEGKVYAVDSDEKVIQALKKKAEKRGHHNIEAHASSAHNLHFIKDESVDFILANDLLCAMAPQHHEAAVNEMKRILKPKGQAYLSATKGWGSYMNKENWEKILEGFRVERSGDPIIGDRWATVSKKQR